MFSAMISGSSHIDSTKKTLAGGRRKTEFVADFRFFRLLQKKTTNLVAIFLGKAEEELSALWGGVGGVKHLMEANKVSF